MFNFGPTEKSGLQKTIDSVLHEMNSVNADSKEFSKMNKQLVKLYSMKDIETPNRVSLDTLVLVTGNLLGIVLIIGHERTHVVTSKALQFVLKAAR